jgi:hypothetical protein
MPIPSELIDKLEKLGKLTPQEAAKARAKINGAPEPTGKDIQHISTDFDTIEVGRRQPNRALAHFSQGMRELFNHNNADLHYEQRMDLEEGIRHSLGLPVYGLIAGIDSIIDALGFGISEVVEDVTFTTGRVIYRAKDGWDRAKIK